VELKVMKEMFEASVDGKAFDMERWGQYFRPAGMQAPSGAAAADADEDVPVAKAAPAAKAPADNFDDEDTPVATVPVSKPAEGNKKAEDILAMIRARQK
jgi:hypothetical protein